MQLSKKVKKFEKILKLMYVYIYISVRIFYQILKLFKKNCLKTNFLIKIVFYIKMLTKM